MYLFCVVLCLFLTGSLLTIHGSITSGSESRAIPKSTTGRRHCSASFFLQAQFAICWVITWHICQGTAWRTCMWSFKTNCTDCPANPAARNIHTARKDGPSVPEQTAGWTRRTNSSSRLCPRPKRTFWWGSLPVRLMRANYCTPAVLSWKLKYAQEMLYNLGHYAEVLFRFTCSCILLPVSMAAERYCSLTDPTLSSIVSKH